MGVCFIAIGISDNYLFIFYYGGFLFKLLESRKFVALAIKINVSQVLALVQLQPDLHDVMLPLRKEMFYLFLCNVFGEGAQEQSFLFWICCGGFADGNVELFLIGVFLHLFLCVFFCVHLHIAIILFHSIFLNYPDILDPLSAPKDILYQIFIILFRKTLDENGVPIVCMHSLSGRLILLSYFLFSFPFFQLFPFSFYCLFLFLFSFLFNTMKLILLNRVDSSF